MRRTLAGALFGLLFVLSPAYPQTITASAQTTIVVNTTPVTGGSNGQCLTISSGTVGSGACGSGGGLTVGTSTITSGTTTRILYDNAGVLGEYTLTGSGTVAVMQTSPTLITPVLGVATATSVAIGGCTIGTDVLCTTGTTTLNGKTTVAGGSFGLSGNISAAAWTTAGIRYANVAATTTDTTSSGTVAAAYTDVFGGNTVAASSAVTFTNYYGAYIKVPVAGTNVTLTSAWALGAEGINVVGQANSIAIRETGYSLTGSSAQSLLDLSGTLNTTGSPDVIALRVTDTGRGAATKFLNIYGGASATTSVFSVSNAGNLVINGSFSGVSTITAAGQIQTNSGQLYSWSSRSTLGSPADGSVKLSNSAGTNSVTISFPTATATPTLQLGALDAAAPISQIVSVQNVIAGTSNTAGVNWTFNGSQGTGTGAGGDIIFQTAKAGTTGTSQNALAAVFTVKNTGVIQNNVVFSAAGTPLPTCNGAAEGSRGAVSDATTPTFLTAYVSGGAIHASVYCDGTSWKTD